MKIIQKIFISFSFIFLLILSINTNVFAADKEMKAAWISTVYNLDWPKTKNNQSKQKQEYIDMLDKLKECGINVVIVQVRPKADAIYQSDINPWSDILTGTIGKNPGYDPLKFLIDEAHKRNMEFHAWFNPYRVTTSGTDLSKLDAKSPARLNPQWVVSYNNKLYYNPGLPEVRKHIVDSVSEIVKKYDIDGVHFDDYFYPDGGFPDDDTYKLYGNGQDKDNWRRYNVNKLLEEVKNSIKSIDKNVVFGVSPAGIWRNKSSDSTGSDTSGSETYSKQFADTRYWIKNNLIDYVTPQLYWPIGQKGSDYSKLVDWWAKEVEGTSVDLYIGQGIYKQGYGNGWSGYQDIASQIKEQVNLNRQYKNIKGSMYFSASDILNTPKLQEDLKELYINSSNSNKQVKMLGGNTRFETAVEISNEGWKDGADTVLLVNGYAIIDGVAATPLATLYDSPILLTNQDSIPQSTKDEIKRLNPKKVILIGTDDVTGDVLINDLYKILPQVNVERIGGIDRYETALLIAQEIEKHKQINTIYIANGYKEADALSIASHAGEEIQPIILTDTDSINNNIYEWIRSKNISDAYFIGDNTVVSDSIINKINLITKQNVMSNRLGGEDRQATNGKVIEKFYSEDSYKSLIVSKSDPLVDALTAGPLAAKLKSPIVIVGNYVNKYQKNILSQKSTDLVYEIGDDINKNSLNQIIQTLR